MVFYLRYFLSGLVCYPLLPQLRRKWVFGLTALYLLVPFTVPPADGVPTKKLFCTLCGTENLADARFCEKCGHAMHRDEGLG